MKIIIFFQILGLILLIIGWHIERIDNYPFLYKSIFRKYYIAQKGYEKLLNEKTLNSNDEGFIEISKIVKGIITSPPPNSLNISKIELSGPNYAIVQSKKGMESKQAFDLEITLFSGKKGKITYYDLDREIKREYLTRNCFFVGSFLFWTGILIELFFIIMQVIPHRQ